MTARYMAWKDGQTFGVLAYDVSKHARGVLICTNNGEQWAATLRPYPITNAIAPELMPPYVTLRDLRSLTRAEPEFRIPLEWAKRTVTEPGRIYTTPAGKLADTEVIAYDSPLTKDLGSVSYTGFNKFARRSGHSLQSIHRAVNSAVARAIEVWGWEADGLEVKFHDAGRAFGLAYAPGSGAESGVRKISLGVKLIATFDLNSIARVIIHELCHHYREERWPRYRTHNSEAHDRLFCESLTKADPAFEGFEKATSNETNPCVTFADVPDTALVAARKAKLAARIQEPTWAPEAGVLNVYWLKSGQVKFSWDPNPGFKWTQWIRPLNDVGCLELLKHFSEGDWNRVSVKIEPKLAKSIRLPESTEVRELIYWVISKFEKKVPKTKAYVEEMEGAK